MHEHRRMDASGRVQAKAETIRSHNATVAKEKADKRKATKTKKDKAAQAAAAVTLITDKTYLAKLTKGELEEQLSGHRLLDTGVPKLIPCKSNLKNNTQRLEHLEAAIDRYTGTMGNRLYSLGFGGNDLKYWSHTNSGISGAAGSFKPAKK
ncbi:hypothetical protein B0H17DRAFT_1150218 [Mycena rosella]|uniref:Uncharacterized protein n=1 Tax=Mycena rosella TaxID=1033263 RepID=A0AAD7BV35_MYCRO|nr:hypothetical protein B0H17DRAFT_1150218 [Mycena rosella]